MRLKTKILLITGAIFLAHFLVVEYIGQRQIRAEVIATTRQQARIIQGMLMSLRTVYQRQFVEHAIPIDENTLGFLPAHAIGQISKEFKRWVESGLSFNNVSDKPRNPANRADAVELEAIRYFRRHQEAKERFVPFTTADGVPYYHFSRPIWVKRFCLKCHGRREDAPPTVRKRYRTGYGYQVGDLRGVMSIKLPARLVDERIAAQLRQDLLTHLLGFVLTFLLLSLVLNRTLLRPIVRLQQAARQLAQGDNRARVAMRGGDEIAEVATSFDRMAEQVEQREQALQNQRAFYAALSQTNKSIIHLDSPQQLFERVCRIAVDYTGLRFAWIGRVNDEQRIIEPLASAGESVCLSRTGFSLDPQSPYGSGPVAIAVRGNCPVVVDDFNREPGTDPWRELATQAEIRSAAIFPLALDGRVMWTFSLYAGPDHFFNTEIRALLEEMACDIIFAIKNYGREEERRWGQQKLEASTRQLAVINQRMRLLLESTGEGIYGLDERGLCTFINRAALEMLGHTRDEVLGRAMHGLVHHSHADGSDYPKEACPITLAYETGTAYKVMDEVFWRRDGNSFPAEYSAYPILQGGQSRGVVVVFRDVTESHALNQEMNFLATHDPLTRLLNRYAFEKHLLELIEEARVEPVGHVLCYMDLDQFKVVNDTCGHVAGDAMLQMLVQVLKSVIRQSDILARLGGDEFGLLLHSCSLEQAYRLARKICDEVKAFRFSWDGKSFTTGMSIGLVAIGPDTESVHHALSAADSACYVAKDQGRNRVHVFRLHDEEVARRQGEMQWVTEIQDALEKQRLSLYCQMLRPLHGGPQKGRHLEVLLRMTDQAGQLVAPGAFIPAAERYDLMASLNRWVIRNTFSWLSQEHTRLQQVEMCSINLSGNSLGEGGLHEFIIEQRRYYGIPAGKICFEVTETAAVSRLDQAIHLIGLLKKLGFHFALDDFGTGMSSFAYLKSLPVDYLKIDGGFVKDILVDPVDRAMVASINEIGHLMGLKTIAEYVENDQILGQLEEIGVDYAQGFAITRPVPLESAFPA